MDSEVVVNTIIHEIKNDIPSLKWMLLTILGRKESINIPSDISKVEDYWEMIASKYFHVKENMKMIVSDSKSLNRLDVAYCMYICGLADKVWLQDLIEKDVNSEYAFVMVDRKGSDPAWAEKIIKRDGCFYFAELMAERGYSEKEWAENIEASFHDDKARHAFCFAFRNNGDIELTKKIIEREKNSHYSYQLYLNGFVEREWAKSVAEKSLNISHALKFMDNESRYGDKHYDAKSEQHDREWLERLIEGLMNSFYAVYMVENFVSDTEWAEKIIEEEGDCASAYKMVDGNYSKPDFAEKLFVKKQDRHHAILMVKNWYSTQEWFDENFEPFDFSDDNHTPLQLPTKNQKGKWRPVERLGVNNEKA